jgi:peptide/nickel transport system permease protein
MAPNTLVSAGGLNPNISAEQIESLKALYGLNEDIYTRYVKWAKSILLLDFGLSFSSGNSVQDEIVSRLPVTILINVISMFLIFVISFYLGIKSAINLNRLTDKVIKQFSLIGYSFASFYLALILIYLLSFKLEIFPISGLHSLNVEGGVWYYIDYAWHLVLPIVVLVFGGIGSLTIYIRSLVIDILKNDYIFFAKARGLDTNTILKKFVLPNLLPPIVTMLGLSLPAIIGGSVILEQIFSINGMGLLFYQSALSRDYPVIMGVLIVGSFLTLFGNMLADLILLKINPFFKNERT